MRIKTLLASATLIGLAVVAGLFGVAGTWALWNDAEPSRAGTVRAANFDIRLNDAPMTTTVTAVEETPGSLLKPDAPVYATVTVANATNAGTPMSVKAVMNPPKVVNPSVPALGTALIVRAAPPPVTGGGCANADYPETNTAATTVLDEGGAARFCLRTSLRVPHREANSVDLTDEEATITTSVTVTQQPRGT